VAFTLPAHDIDDQFERLIVEVPVVVRSGTLTRVGGATYLYTPNAGFMGTDWFEYCVADQSGAKACAIVTLTVVNRPPVAKPQSVSTLEDTPVSFRLEASDPDDDGLTYTITAGPMSGVLTGVAPELTYKPNADFNGTDTFTYTVTDTDGATSSPVSVTLAVTPVNDPPRAEPARVTTRSNAPIAIVLTAGDVDGQTLTWLTTTPRAGTLSGEAPNVTYTPGTGFAGIDQFAFTVFDGQELSIATVTITVTGTPLTLAPASAEAFANGELEEGKVGREYAAPMPLQASGGGAPYTWSVAAGTLPAGLVLNASTGQISGVPSQQGRYTFTLQVVDHWGDVDQQVVSLRIK
jgi:hypothetical protein